MIHAGNDSALNAEIKSAYERKAPVMAWVYAPNWTMSVYKGEWINFPDYTPDCYNDPKWGTNPDLAYDCGKPHGPVKKLGSNDFATKWPKAFAMVGKYKMDNDTIGALAKKVDIDKRSVEDVAAEWVKANEATWKKWLE